ncbi:MAG: bifunctional metallophosphatase/5'-nucleotidase [Rhizobacter sp.]|nr:bifunctional metallophosphatase/5'-nucleotidase [Chlorobiales bacterium]
MKPLLLPAICCLFVFSACASPEQTIQSASQNSSVKTLRVIHWNDFHSQNVPFTIKPRDAAAYSVSGSAAFKTYLDSLRKLSEQSSEAYIVLNGGDDFQGTPISSITKGRSQILLMNRLAPDAVVPGNHEFDYGGEHAIRLLKSEATFPVICANLVYHDSQKNVFEPYRIITRAGVKMAVIGLLTNDLARLSLSENIKNLDALPYDDVLPKIISEIKSLHQPDVIIVVSHIGLEEDKLLAEKYPEVMFFAGGHSHTAVKTPVKVRNSYVGQAGSRGQFIGEAMLGVDTAADTLTMFSGKLIEVRTASLAPDAAIQALVDSLEKPVEQALGEVIGELKKDWKRQGGRPSNLGAWESEAMRKGLGTDIGIQNTGGLRKDLYAGPIKVRDLWEINPFGNAFVTFSLTGAELKKAIEWQLADKSELCDMSGLYVRFDTTAAEGKRVKELQVGGAPVDEKKIYTASTNNYVGTHLQNFFGLDQQKHALTYTPYSDHDFYIEAVRNEKIISGDNVLWYVAEGMDAKPQSVTPKPVKKSKQK